MSSKMKDFRAERKIRSDIVNAGKRRRRELQSASELFSDPLYFLLACLCSPSRFSFHFTPTRIYALCERTCVRYFDPFWFTLFSPKTRKMENIICPMSDAFFMAFLNFFHAYFRTWRQIFTSLCLWARSIVREHTNTRIGLLDASNSSSFH